MSQRLEAYREIMPKLPTKRAAVYAAISSQGENGATLSELVGILGWAINRISGRVTELSRFGFLREAGVRGGQTIWVACPPQEHLALPRRRKAVKAVFEAAQEPDLFGRMTITVSIPSNIPIPHLVRGAKISFTIPQETI